MANHHKRRAAPPAAYPRRGDHPSILSV